MAAHECILESLKVFRYLFFFWTFVPDRKVLSARDSLPVMVMWFGDFVPDWKLLSARDFLPVMVMEFSSPRSGIFTSAGIEYSMFE